MKLIEKLLQNRLPRRDFVRWLMKATSAAGLFSLFGNSVFGKGDAAAAQSSNTAVLNNTDKTISVSGRHAQRILLKNGLIVDGTGKKPFPGSLLINKGQIELVTAGNVEFKGNTIDCSDRVIAPGIIDMHSHMDSVLPATGRDDLTSPFTRQGVTTFIGGNCGYGPAGFRKGSYLIDEKSPNQDFYKTIVKRSKGLYSMQWDSMGDYFDYLIKQGISHNLATLVGNGTTRTSVQGFDPTPM